MSNYHVLIPCAGHGARMQSALPKQYLLLNEKPVLLHAIDVFESMPLISSVTVVIAENDVYWSDTLLAQCHKTRVIRCGGETRAATVMRGLQALSVPVDDWVLVHDAARPGVDAAMLERLILTAESSACGAILAIPLADTLKRADAQAFIVDTQSRVGLWQAQTPQMFRREQLQLALEAHMHKQPTDEAQAMEWMGHHPQLVVGGLKNMKITYPDDLKTVAALMQSSVQSNV